MKHKKQKTKPCISGVVDLLFLLLERLSVTGAKVQGNDNNDVTIQRDKMTTDTRLGPVLGCLVHGVGVWGSMRP